MTGTLIVTLVLVPFAIVAIILLGLGCYELWKLRTTRGWRSTTGTVLAATIEGRTATTPENPSTAYYPCVMYVYQVDGQTYQGTRFSVGQVGVSSHSAVQRQVARYPIGSAVRVFYDSARPMEAVLERKNSLSFFFLLSGVGVLVVVIALYAFFRNLSL